ncbi:MAG: VIT1/CCC1 transporter family protein [Pseudomonadota bacterium]
MGREGWLRAAVLGADDGIVSTASLMIGVAAASAPTHSVLIAGVAGLAAGAMSMAAGEYVSVSSQRDAEEANIAVEKRELAGNPEDELRELALIYEKRGLEPELAKKVSEQLSRHDRLEAHLRDELGLNESTRARPLQAALVSAASFGALATLPIVALLASTRAWRIPVIALSALASLALLGALGGHLAGASKKRAALRVLVGGGLGMAISAVIGRLLGVATS